MKIAAKLKELRINTGLNIGDVIMTLQSSGFIISKEDLLGFETNTEELDADTFLALCKIYECDDIMSTFHLL